MKKLSIPSIENLKIIGEILYNFYGNEFYLNLVSNYYQSKAMISSYKGMFLSIYYQYYNEVKQAVNKGEVFKYPLFTLGTTSQKPFIYNSLN